MTRAMARAVAMVLLLFLGLILLIAFFPWWSSVRQLRVKRVWSRWVMRAVGVRWASDSAPPELPAGPTMVVMNHVSWLDIIILNAVIPSTFVAKSEIRNWPLIGLLAARTGTVFIERGSRHAVRHVNHEIVKRLANGEVITFFPEGTTSDGRHVLPFHASLFAMAVADREHHRAGAAVVPVALSYFHHGRPTTRVAYVGEQTLMQSMMSVLATPGLQVVLDILPTIPADDGASATRHGLAALAHARIAAAVAVRQSNGQRPVH